MLPDECEDVFRDYILPSAFKVEQEHAGIVVITLGFQPDPVYPVCNLRDSCVRSGNEDTVPQIHFPQLPYRINHKRVRIEVDYSLYGMRKQMRRKETVIHLPWVLAADRSIPE